MASTEPLPAGSHAARWRDVRHLLGTVSPGIAWITIFLVIPSGLLISVAFMSTSAYGLPQLPWTLESFRELAGYGILGWSPGNLMTLVRSLWYTVVATGLVMMLAYPLAFYISTRRASVRPLMLLLIVVPSWTNQVIRAYGWMNLLAPDTPLSRAAVALGVIPPHMGLYPSNFAVILGLIYNFLPFMVLPLYAAFEKLDYEQVEAARDLYGNPLQAFRHAVLPQTLSGLLAGIVLVAIPAFGMFVVPQLLGGGKEFMLGNLVANQFTASSNWPLGAAGALLMLVATLLGLIVLRRLGRRLGGGEDMVI